MLELKEYVNKRILSYILDNHELFKDKLGASYIGGRLIEGDAQLTLLKKYYNSLDQEGVKTTLYTQRRTNKITGDLFGRHFAKGGLSLQGMSRAIRHTIAGNGLYFDIDISNCHPTICQFLCLKHNIECTQLTYYIEHREEVLSLLVGYEYQEWNKSTHKKKTILIDRDYAKKIMIKGINGGSFEEGYNIPFIKSYFEETTQILERLQVLYPEMNETAIEANKRRKLERGGFENVIGTCSNYIYTDYEDKMWFVIYQKCQELGLNVNVNSFDGLMSYHMGSAKERYTKHLFPRSIKAIKEQYGLDIVLTIKSSDEAFEVNIPDSYQPIKKFEHIVNSDVIKYWEGQNIIEDKTINKRYLETNEYEKLLSLYDLITIQGNMNTGKTFGLKELKYEKVLIITYRISLDVELSSKFGYKLYSDIKEPLIDSDIHTKLVCQIDSLHRVMGSFDLVIVDEASYTLSHLCNFVKRNKADVIRALQHHLSTASKVVACDALFKKRHIQSLERLVGRRAYVVKNKYKSFAGYKASLIKGSRHTLLEKVEAKIALGKKIIVPSNSSDAVLFLHSNLTVKYPHLKIAMIDKDTEKIEPDKWIDYDVFMYTPTYESGVSLDKKHFHCEIAYMTGRSSAPSNFTQMLFRNRQLIDKDITIIYANLSPLKCPIYKQQIINDIKSTKDGIFEAGLTVNYSLKDLDLQTPYSTTYFDLVIGDNMDRTEFKLSVENFLIDHGVVCSDDEFKCEANEDTKSINDCIKGEAEMKIVNRIYKSRNLTSSEFEHLKTSTSNKIEDSDAMKKYQFERDYHIDTEQYDPQIMYELMDDSEKFVNLCKVSGGADYIKSRLGFKGDLMTNSLNDEDQNNTFTNLIIGNKSLEKDLHLYFTLEMCRAFGIGKIEHDTEFEPSFEGLTNFFKSNPIMTKKFIKSTVNVLSKDITEKAILNIIKAKLKSLLVLDIHTKGQKCRNTRVFKVMMLHATFYSMVGIKIYTPEPTHEELTKYEALNPVKSQTVDIYGKEIVKKSLARRVIRPTKEGG